jgi:hypothetical protein
MSTPALGSSQSPTQWVLGTLFPGVKQVGCETDCLPPSSIKVKNVWSCTSAPIYVCMAWCLMKHRIFLHGMVLS